MTGRNDRLQWPVTMTQNSHILNAHGKGIMKKGFWYTMTFPNDPPKMTLEWPRNWPFNDREMTPKFTILNDPKKVQKSSSCLLALTKLFANKHHGEHNHHGAKIRIFIAWKIRPHSRQWCVECIPFDNRHQPWQSPSKSERYSSLTISIKLGQSLLWCVLVCKWKLCSLQLAGQWLASWRCSSVTYRAWYSKLGPTDFWKSVGPIHIFQVPKNMSVYLLPPMVIASPLIAHRLYLFVFGGFSTRLVFFSFWSIIQVLNNTPPLRTNKFLRNARGTTALCAADAKIIKGFMPYDRWARRNKICPELKVA